MIDSEPRLLAEKFLKLQKEALIIPLDDQNLGAEGYLLRKRHRADSPNCLHFMEEMEELLSQSLISPYFREHLVYEFGLEYVTGYTSEDPILEGNKKSYGISLEAKQYGFFDPALSFGIELRYFKNQAMIYLIAFERMGIYRPVNWREWNTYLRARQISFN